MSAYEGVLLLQVGRNLLDHERVVHERLGEKFGALLDCPFLGQYDSKQHAAERYFLIPDETLCERAGDPAVEGLHSFFGGRVPHPYLATKAISHPLIEVPSRTPDDWSGLMMEMAASSVLQGFTVFDASDALYAGEILLKQGPLRLKPVRAKAGRGQQVIDDLDELSEALHDMPAEEIAAWGLVLEENLEEPQTFSVGQIRVGEHVLSYCGSQCLTRDNAGESVYGGSDLTLVRGGYEQLLSLKMAAELQLAIEQARLYEEAAFASYPDILASRRNYDVACGEDHNGRPRSGVLEQSWRIGGASAAEIFALEAFSKDPALTTLRASTRELHGNVPAPNGYTPLYQGTDPELGQLSKYVKVEPYDSA